MPITNIFSTKLNEMALAAKYRTSGFLFSKPLLYFAPQSDTAAKHCPATQIADAAAL
jgi:hypothetical protein